MAASAADGRRRNLEARLVSLPLGPARPYVYAGVTEVYSRVRGGRTSYSQYAEDLLVMDFFAGAVPASHRPDPGFYVDIGAYHPRFISNTHALSRAGWHGLVVDVDQTKLDRFSTRKNCTPVCCVVSDHEGTIDFYKFRRMWSEIDTLDATQAEKYREEFGIEYDVVALPTKPLPTIFEENGVRHIDFLNVDIEGHDLAALKTLDFERWRPTLLCVEDHANSFVKPSDLDRFLDDREYLIYAHVGVSKLYADRRIFV
jgi:FkbM family methyltransferase